MKPKITIRLGSLADPLEQRASADGITESEVIRRALAKTLGVQPPVMEVGNPEVGTQSAAAIRKRWGKRRKL